jgi:hypothetical protein
MREGMFIIPKRDNNGNDLAEVVSSALSALTERFGGATVVEGRGVWRDETGKLYQEPVSTITTAYNPDPAADASFQSIAVSAAMQAAQHAVYVRTASGDVSIVSLVEPAVQAA